MQRFSRWKYPMSRSLRFLPLIVLSWFMASPFLSGGEPARPGSSRRFRNVKLKIGQPAPDVVLSPLTFVKNDQGELVGKIGREKVKLSDYKGKAPVCIFSSSYT